MALANCPVCLDDDELFVVRVLDTGRKLVGCGRCGQEWEHGEATVKAATLRNSFSDMKARFPRPQDVDPAVLARVAALKAEFLHTTPEPDPRVAPYWATYQQVFSREGLSTCDPQLLKDFANSEVGAHSGNQATFNSAWNELGAAAAADRTRRTVDYLLHGPDSVPLEDRLTQLLNGEKAFSMPGFKEALLTRVLCVVQPDRFLSILKYTTEAGGKREIAQAVFQLDLPVPENVNWTLGRLILWSNDVLRVLVGEGFQSQQHAAAFLWWAKDQPRS